MCSSDIFLGILAILFPPLAVWVKCGICSADSLINILLCVLGYIPGLLHAWYIIAKHPEPAYEYETINQDAEGGRSHRRGQVTYVYVQSPGASNDNQQQQQPRQQEQGGMNYGTNSAGEGGSDGVPPSYADVLSEGVPETQTPTPGDNKVQRP